MMILVLLCGIGTALLSTLLLLLPAERKISPARESFEESSKRRDKYLAQMRRDRFENSAANELREKR
jgi:hypothetical protein